MGKHDQQLQAVEESINNNVQRLRELLDALPINDLYRETDEIRQLHNQQVEEYNHRFGRAIPVAPELNEELTKPELMQLYVKLYEDGNKLAITIQSSKKTEKAMRARDKKPAAKEAEQAEKNTLSDNNTKTPFQSQIATLCQEYGKSYKTQQTIQVAIRMEKENEEALKKYKETRSSFYNRK